MRRIREGIDEKLDQAIREIESDQPLSFEQRSEIANKLKQTRKEFNKLHTWVAFAEKMADFGLWEHDFVEDTITWSDETYRLWGYEPEAITPSVERFIERVHPEDQDQVMEAYTGSQQKQNEFHITYRLKLPDETVKFVESHGMHFYDEDGTLLFTLGTNQNVTNREREKRQMISSLQENETILDEIHHRVKNNLAVVAGMLQLQWLQEEDPEFADKLQDSANRIKTVAGIHEQLYESNNFANISLGKNIENLARNLIESMETDTEIELNTDCDEVHLDFRQTLPCSLIANEVITNAIKYAFKGRDEGIITIQLQTDGDNLELSITDNGVGLPDDFQEKEGSLGMNLIETLSAQLDAEYHFDTSPDSGTAFGLRFGKVPN
jgi:two-component sensor histidine kinase